MRRAAPHLAWLIVSLVGLGLGAGLGLAGCPAEGGTIIDYDNLIRVNDASDEVLGAIVDIVDNEGPIVDDDKAASIVTPEPGASLPAATPPTFAWSLPQAKAGAGAGERPKTPRHGTATGDFTWLRFSGGGLPAEVDVLAVDVTMWTPSATEWARLTVATGPITLTLTNAFVMDGVVRDGPYQRATPTTFSISAGQ